MDKYDKNDEMTAKIYHMLRECRFDFDYNGPAMEMLTDLIIQNGKCIYDLTFRDWITICKQTSEIYHNKY